MIKYEIIKVQGRDGKEQLFDLKDVTVFIERHENNNNKNVNGEGTSDEASKRGNARITYNKVSAILQKH